MATKSDINFNELQKKNFENAMRLAQISVENSQKIMQLQVDAAKNLFEDSMNNAKEISATSDPQSAMALRAKFAQQSTERMLMCAREMAELASQTQAEFGKMVSEQLTSGGQDVFNSMQNLFRGMPMTDNNAMSAIQTAMETTRSAFEQMTRASTEAFKAFQNINSPK